MLIVCIIWRLCIMLWEAMLKLSRYLNGHWRSGVVPLGENHRDYGASLSGLAAMYYDIGSYAKAEPLYQKALEMTRRTLGENHPDYAHDLINLGLIYREINDDAKAQQLFKQALEIRRKYFR